MFGSVAVLYGNKLEDEIKFRILQHFKVDIEEAKNIVKTVMDCLSKRDHMTVFSLEEGGSASDIDVTMLKALLKVNRHNRVDQLKLALAWNRVDVATEDILTDEVFEKADLKNLMHIAIVNDRVDFVKLFLEKEIHFQNLPQIESLYNDSSTKRAYPFLFEQETAVNEITNITLKDVGTALKRLINDFYEPMYMYCDERYAVNEPCKRHSLHDAGGISNKRDDTLRDGHGLCSECVAQRDLVRKTLKTNETYLDPARDIFLWCVFMRMKDMAMIFWQKAKDDMALALTAQQMLQSMAKLQGDSDDVEDIHNQIKFYKELAVNVLRTCYSADESKTIQLLVRELTNFGRTTVLQNAVQAKNMEFVAHPACQRLLTTLWMGQMTDDNSILLV